MFVYAYKFLSKSARAIAEALDYSNIRHENSKFKGNGSKIVLNWGSSEVPNEVLKCKIINIPSIVKRACNKRHFFTDMSAEGHDDIIPQWTTDPAIVRSWLNEGFDVCVRQSLTGNSGEGLSIIKPGDEVPVAPLYTLYEKKSDEYRVHVVNGEVIDVQRKARRLATPDDKVNWQIRNHDNGFVFARGDLNVPQKVKEVAVIACNVMGLHFGGVDVIWKGKSGRALVIEINTAPGVEGTTVQKYAEALRSLAQALRG